MPENFTRQREPAGEDPLVAFTWSASYWAAQSVGNTRTASQEIWAAEFVNNLKMIGIIKGCERGGWFSFAPDHPGASPRRGRCRRIPRD